MRQLDEFKKLSKEEQIALLVAEADRLQANIDTNKASIAEYKEAKKLTDDAFDDMDSEIDTQQDIVNDLREDVFFGEFDPGSG